MYGFGEQKTPKPFVVACDKFIYTEVLRNDAPSVREGAPPPRSVKAKRPTHATDGEEDSIQGSAPNPPKAQKSPVNLLTQAIEQAADESGWAFLGAVGLPH